VIHKLEGTQAAVGGEGANMPLTGGALSADQIDMIATWIDDGALQ
jgi:hypothetical protein